MAACAAVSLLVIALGVFACRKRRRNAQVENAAPMQQLVLPEASFTSSGGGESSSQLPSAGVYGDVSSIPPESTAVGEYAAAPIAGTNNEYEAADSPLTMGESNAQASLPRNSGVADSEPIPESSYAAVTLSRQNEYEPTDAPLD